LKKKKLSLFVKNSRKERLELERTERALIEFKTSFDPAPTLLL